VINQGQVSSCEAIPVPHFFCQGSPGPELFLGEPKTYEVDQLTNDHHWEHIFPLTKTKALALFRLEP
jgi:hypothetical protein